MGALPLDGLFATTIFARERIHGKPRPMDCISIFPMVIRFDMTAPVIEGRPKESIL